MRRARSTPGVRAVVNIAQLGFTRLDLALHRRLGRSLGGLIARAPVLVLTTTGRKSGKRRRTPLVYVADAQTYLVVAAYGGSPWNPHWYANLQTNSGAGIEVRGQSITVQAQLVTGDARATLWPRMRTEIASLRTAESRTDREIPLIRLVPTSHKLSGDRKLDVCRPPFF